MPVHHTRSTVSAAFWCGKCGKQTPHRIDDRRRGPCLVCIDRLEGRAAPPAVEEMVTLVPQACGCPLRPYPHFGLHGYNPPWERITRAQYERRKELDAAAAAKSRA